jgi:hypothetical protein
MRTLSIGDIHGRNDWTYFTHGSPQDFDRWAISIDNGAPANDGLWAEEFDNYMDYDKIIFVGDYVDSFNVGNAEMKKNLEDIIFFKKTCPDKVVLLLGNHDIQYIVANEICSGYRPEMKHDFYKIFMDNIELFSFAYEGFDKDGKTWLWTHAGVTSGWYKELRKELFDPNHRFAEIVKERNPQTIAEEINLAWELKMSVLYNVDAASGGHYLWAGPIWVRPHVLNIYPLDGVSQIVGHTPQARIWRNEVNDTVEHVYIDCLEHGGDNGDCFELEL